MADDLRLLRWRDFLRRAEFSPASVYRHRCDGWPYIPIHPFADEAAELARVGMAPEDCASVEAWWGIEGDATLVESCISRLAHHSPGLYARQTEHEEGWVYLLTVLDAPYVTRGAFESALSRFASLGFPDDEQFRLIRGSRPVRLVDVQA
jgi:hypothetical protein